MAQQQRISNPVLTINDEPVSYVPEGIDIDNLGLGERTVSVATTGQGNNSLVVGDDLTTRKSNIKIDLYNTSESLTLTRKLKNNRENNVIAMSDPENNLVFRECTMINSPGLQATSEGNIEMIFEGLPVE